MGTLGTPLLMGYDAALFAKLASYIHAKSRIREESNTFTLLSYGGLRAAIVGELSPALVFRGVFQGIDFQAK